MGGEEFGVQLEPPDLPGSAGSCDRLLAPGQNVGEGLGGVVGERPGAFVDAVLWVFLNAGPVQHVDARFGDDIGHGCTLLLLG